MPRVKRGVVRRAKRRKLAGLTKGYFQNKSKLYKFMKEAAEKGGLRLRRPQAEEARLPQLVDHPHQRRRARERRLLSVLMNGLKAAGVELDRKSLATPAASPRHLPPSSRRPRRQGSEKVPVPVPGASAVPVPVTVTRSPVQCVAGDSASSTTPHGHRPRTSGTSHRTGTSAWHRTGSGIVTYVPEHWHMNFPIDPSVGPSRLELFREELAGVRTPIFSRCARAGSGARAAGSPPSWSGSARPRPTRSANWDGRRTS